MGIGSNTGRISETSCWAKEVKTRGAWVAQSIKRPTGGFSSGHELTIRELEPHIRLCAESEEPAWDSRSPSLSLPLPCSLAVSLSVSK